METQPERDFVVEVTTRLRSRFPHLDDEVLTDAVTSTLESYRDSKVQDFVPILVERDAAAHLRRDGTRAAV